MATLLFTGLVTQFSGLTGWALLGAQFAAGVAGTIADTALRSALMPTQRVLNEGPRLNQLTMTGSVEGSPMTRLYGGMRLGGQIIWATRFKETVTEDTESVGISGGGQSVTNREYSYSVSFAVAFCEGNRKTDVGRVWFDGKEVDLSNYEWRFYRGTESQEPDPLIQSVEGADSVPAFRGTCYLVFEDLPLEEFGNRIPQVTAEIICPLVVDDPDDISQLARSFCLIPASGEFVYGTEKYRRDANKVSGKPSSLLNVHNNRGRPDFIDAMQRLALMQDELHTIALVVGWFGDDLRIGHCEIRPKVEFAQLGSEVTPADWSVAGLARADAHEVSRDADGDPYYGGTPSDDVVRQAIVWLKEHGYRVIFYPFIFMDVAPGNTLPNPYSDHAGAIGQVVFPWRGRITCSPAAGFADSVDKTSDAGDQVEAFFDGEWGFRRFILHYADLCAEVGGVDAFLIGSEMVGMTQIRSDANSYPAVARLKALAGDVRAILGAGVKISYAADWSEYHSHRPDDGTGDVFFNLDPLWSDPNIDFVGIDNYLPISDWQDGADHLDYDAEAGIVVPHNVAYLKNNIEGGEYFDWYYASDAARRNQLRTPIADTAYGKHWVFRQKDIRSWWKQGHRNRPGGVEAGGNTAWTPESKPIWFTEYGCPAVDKGTNQPNLFVDPKSSESGYPHFSSRAIDESIQRAYIEAMTQYWRDNAPASSVYDGAMLRLQDMVLWCWDARPYPAYPSRRSVWSDGDLWRKGHWQTGRLDLVSLPRLVEHFCAMVEMPSPETSLLAGPQSLVRGYAVDNIMPVRDMLSPLMSSHQFDCFESGGQLRFVGRATARMLPIGADELVIDDSKPVGYEIVRGQEIDLPNNVKISYINARRAYNVASVDGKKHGAVGVGVDATTFPEVMDVAYARALADSLVQQAWTAREHGAFLLPPSRIAIDPGDGVFLDIGERVVTGRVVQIETGSYRSLEFAGYDASLYAVPDFPDIAEEVLGPVDLGPAMLIAMDIPLLDPEGAAPRAPRLVAWSNPWPGSIAVYRDDGNGGWRLNTTIDKRASVGELRFPLYSGVTDVWDDGNEVYVQLYSGTLATATDGQVLNGANSLAVQNEDGDWEILQFAKAELQGDRQYKLTRLLRGQLGTERAMRNPVAAGALVVALDVRPDAYLKIGREDLGNSVALRWGPARLPVDDANYREGTVTPNGVALRPWSPVHLAGSWNTVTGDITLSWIRRTRFDGDSWEPRNVPINESAELYDLQIFDGSDVVRTVEDIEIRSFVYTAAMQAADFGALQASVKFRVFQLSAVVGRGAPATETVFR